jgi:hypothetical protein
MQIEKKFFPRILRTNDELYFLHLEGVLESIDELASMQIIKHKHKYSFRIAPSIPKYINPIIEELTKFHNKFGLRMNMAKSIKTNAVIDFDISLE